MISESYFRWLETGVQGVVPRFKVDGTTYMSTKDVAEVLDIAPGTLRALLSRGVLPDVTKQTHVTRKQRGFTEEWVIEAAAILGKTLPEAALVEWGEGAK